MLEEAYYYGLSPREAKELTPAEMASFIKARRKQEMDITKVNSYIGYAAGIVGSAALSKKRPKFSDLFNFPKDPDEKIDFERSKAMMLVWAETANRADRKKSRKGGKDRG